MFNMYWSGIVLKCHRCINVALISGKRVLHNTWSRLGFYFLRLISYFHFLRKQYRLILFPLVYYFIRMNSVYHPYQEWHINCIETIFKKYTKSLKAHHLYWAWQLYRWHYVQISMFLFFKEWCIRRRIDKFWYRWYKFEQIDYREHKINPIIH